jgi:hypothetical protein
MSLIDTYRGTLKSLFYGDKKRLLVTTEYGANLIKNVFTQKELLDMEILCISILGDYGIFKQFKKNTHEVVFFVESEENFDLISRSLPLCKTKVYINFYAPISKQIADKLLVFDIDDLIQDIVSSSLGFIPISNYAAVSDKTNIFPIMKKLPTRLVFPTVSGKTNSRIQSEISSKIQECVENCTLYERSNENTILVALERSYDEITPLIMPWRYESMLHYHKLKIKNHFGHCNDIFFSENRYNTYEEVSKKVIKESGNVSKLTGPKNAKEAMEYADAGKIVSKHADILLEMKKLIFDNNLLKKSEFEQRALIRDLSSAEKEYFLTENNILARKIYAEKVVTHNSDKSIYYQHVPKIREIIEEYTKTSIYQTIYIYVKDYICYEEVAEVELFNKTSKIKVYLLSDSILDQWNYMGLVNKNIQKDNLFRVSRPTKICKSSSNSVSDTKCKDDIFCLMSKSNLDIIQNKIVVLENFPHVIFDDIKEKEFDRLFIEITNLLTKEYDKLKKPTEVKLNQLQENDKKIKLLKLNKLAARFKDLEYRKIAQKENSSTSISKYFDNTDNYGESGKKSQIKQYLLEETYDEVGTAKYVDERGEQIIKIAQDVYQINSLFLDLKRLTEEQNLLLDQIEVNVIDSADLTKQGTENIIQADKSHESATSLQQKITMGLGIVATILFGGVAIKFGLHN